MKPAAGSNRVAGAQTGAHPAQTAPDGMEYHCAFMADGNLRVSEIWDSQEKFEAFGQRLMPILAEVEIDPGTPGGTKRSTLEPLYKR
jgi:hypothetical protein